MPQKSKNILTFAFYWLMIAIEKQKERGVNMEKGSGAARKSIISTEMKKDDFAKEIMERMEELEFDVEDAETFPAFLEQKIKKNNERFEKEKPFAIYRGYRKECANING